MSRLSRPWIGWVERLARLFHVNFVPRILVLQVVGAVTTFMMMLPAAWRRARLVCMPPWYVKSTAEAHVPVVVILVWGWHSHYSCWRSLLSIVGWRLPCEC